MACYVMFGHAAMWHVMLPRCHVLLHHVMLPTAFPAIGVSSISLKGDQVELSRGRVQTLSRGPSIEPKATTSIINQRGGLSLDDGG